MENERGEKPVVNFIRNELHRKPTVGFRACVQVTNHPRQAEFQWADGWVSTSPVIWVNEDGSEFETQNSKYVGL